MSFTLKFATRSYCDQSKLSSNVDWHPELGGGNNAWWRSTRIIRSYISWISKFLMYIRSSSLIFIWCTERLYYTSGFMDMARFSRMLGRRRWRTIQIAGSELDWTRAGELRKSKNDAVNLKLTTRGGCIQLTKRKGRRKWWKESSVFDILDVSNMNWEEEQRK